mmetsp:Transcript_16322/g.18863  ORF Transcript_16322/g.18863 Transcript_16322/m.18863 type:complete len:108 (-) Transcript_16322:57-380(-)
MFKMMQQNIVKEMYLDQSGETIKIVLIDGSRRIIGIKSIRKLAIEGKIFKDPYKLLFSFSDGNQMYIAHKLDPMPLEYEIIDQILANRYIDTTEDDDDEGHNEHEPE